MVVEQKIVFMDIIELKDFPAPFFETPFNPPIYKYFL